MSQTDQVFDTQEKTALVSIYRTYTKHAKKKGKDALKDLAWLTGKSELTLYQTIYRAMKEESEAMEKDVKESLNIQ